MVDFGLARRLELGDPEDSTQPTPVSELLTQTSLAGTPAYMSPEQVNRIGVDARTDQYSFCVALYEALFGERPYQANAPAAILQEIAAGRVQPPARPTSAHVPLHVIRAVMKGLSKAPGDRFADMPALLAELRRDPWARRWQVLAIGLVGTLAVAAAWPQTEPDPCADVPDPTARVWGDSERAAVERSYEATGAPRWKAAYDRLDDELKQWAQGWTEQRHEVCVAHHVERAESAVLHDGRARCLRRARGEVDALVETLLEADAAMVETMRLTAAKLPDLARCRGEQVQSTRSLPDDPRVAEIEGKLSQGSAKALVGRTAEALQSAEGALHVADDLGEATLLSDAEALRGRILRTAGRASESIEAFQRAAIQAEVAADDAARLVGWLGFVDAALLSGEFDLANRGLDIAAAIVDRIDAGPALRGQLLSLRAQWESDNDNYERAIEIGGQALEQLQQAYGPEAFEVLDQRAALGTSMLFAGRGDEGLALLKRVRDGYVQQLGPDEPSLAREHYRVALAYYRLGRLEPAIVPLQRAIELREPYALEGDMHLVDCYRLYSILLGETGDGDAAYALLLKAKQLADALPEDDRRRHELIAQIAEQDFLVGRHQAVIDVALDWVLTERSKGAFSNNIGLIEYRLIRSLVEVGETERARALIVDLIGALEDPAHEAQAEFLADRLEEVRVLLDQLDAEPAEDEPAP